MLGVNVNLWWGLVMLLFGGLMLAFAARAKNSDVRRTARLPPPGLDRTDDSVASVLGDADLKHGPARPSCRARHMVTILFPAHQIVSRPPALPRV